jgi:hypothetical protein
MAHLHRTEAQHTAAQIAPAGRIDVAAALPQRRNVEALRFAVSLTNPQGVELFRKQFASSLEADSFAMASAELCPEYKVSSVDRIGGLAYELMGHELTITASPGLDKGTAADVIEKRSA